MLSTRWLIVSCLLALTGPAACQAGGLEAQARPEAWVVTWDGRPVCEYAHAPGLLKPYVRLLATLAGDNVLRDAPHDHLHHHGLMYAIRVNGTNFWEETSGAGTQRGAGQPRYEQGNDAGGRPWARLIQRLEWLPPTVEGASAPQPALHETRTLTLTADPASGSVQLDWVGDFTVGDLPTGATLHGSNYNGLGMRFLAELDPIARHEIAGTQPDLGDARQAVLPGDWAAVRFERPDRPLTVALLAAPGNPFSPARFFAMRQPFAYLSATQGLDEVPRTLPANSDYRLAYRILLRPGLIPADAIAASAAELASDPAIRAPK